MDPCPLPGEWWATMGVGQEGLNWSTISNCADDLFLPFNSPSPDLNALDEIFFSIDAEMIGSVGLGSVLPQPLSDFHIPLANFMVLSSKEHHALGHWQTTFSIYRTTKDPKWSTHKLLLDLGSYNTMIMHLIPAVSINDACHRQENAPASQEAQNHFDAGARELIETIENPEENYIILMAAFLFLYLYMPKRNPVSRQRLKQRSRIVLNYIKKHRLDTQCLESRLYNDSSEKSASLSSRKQSVLARLIIWTYGKDVKCGFKGLEAT
jgi:hypothetical protein